jgi:hypothetical protein
MRSTGKSPGGGGKTPNNEKADEWAKLAAEKPDAHGVEPLPRSLAHLKREISEKK